MARVTLINTFSGDVDFVSDSRLYWLSECNASMPGLPTILASLNLQATAEANEQHYEVPTELYDLCLG
jgi:predicted NAD/FAD-dependent oxidoreductase